MNRILIWNLFWDCRSVAVVSLLTFGQHEWSRNEKLTTWRTVWFSCVCLYRVESDGNKLLTNLSYHCIAFGIDILYFVFVIGLVIIICGIIVDVCVRFTMSMVALVGSTFMASVSMFHPRYIFGNCPCSMKPYSSEIWRISTSNWHIAQLAIVDEPYLEGVKDRLWRHSSFACDSRYRTHIFPSFLGNLPNQ